MNTLPIDKQTLEELENLAKYQESRIRKFRKDSKNELTLEGKLTAQKKAHASERILHALRLSRFQIEDNLR